MSTINTTECIVCAKPSSSRCAQCKSAPYCSPAHQKQDWRNGHKDYCNKVKEAGEATFQAILFPENERKPRIVKVPWTWPGGKPFGPDSIERPWHKIEYGLWFGKRLLGETRLAYINSLGAKGPLLGYTIAVVYEGAWRDSGAPPNRCIRNITNGRQGLYWGGNMLILRAQHPYSEIFSDVDVDQDLVPVLKFLEQFDEQSVYLTDFTRREDKSADEDPE